MYSILFFKSLILVLSILLGVAFLTAAERKVMGSMQQRKGPNVTGFLGLLQPIADGLKLFVKETTIPTVANPINFVIAPFLTFFLALLAWAVIPINEYSPIADLNIGLIYIFAISSLGVYGIISAGWASNSKYAFLGALRSGAQMVSYEVSIGLILISVLLCCGTLNLVAIAEIQNVWFAVPLFVPAILFLISILAETNRAPFDLPEAEAELVSGYNVEYSAFGFALFFLGEYANMILMSALAVVFFFGGFFYLPLILLNDSLNSFTFSLKISGILFFFIWVRATFPRYRYDQLMRLGWKILLPLSLGYVLLTSGLLQYFSVNPF